MPICTLDIVVKLVDKFYFFAMTTTLLKSITCIDKSESTKTFLRTDLATVSHFIWLAWENSMTNHAYKRGFNFDLSLAPT